MIRENQRSEFVSEQASVVSALVFAVDENKASVLVKLHADLVMSCGVKESSFRASFGAESERHVEKVLAKTGAPQVVLDSESRDVEDAVHSFQIFVSLFREIKVFDIVSDLQGDGADRHIVLVEKAQTGCAGGCPAPIGTYQVFDADLQQRLGYRSVDTRFNA